MHSYSIFEQNRCSPPLNWSQGRNTIANKMKSFTNLKWNGKSRVFRSSSSISVKISSALLQCVYDVHGSDGLSFGSFSVHDWVPGDSDEHGIHKFPGRIVWVFSNSLNASSSGQSSESSFGNLEMSWYNLAFSDKSFGFVFWSLFTEFSFSSHWVLCLKLIIRNA